MVVWKASPVYEKRHFNIQYEHNEPAHTWSFGARGDYFFKLSQDFKLIFFSI